MIKTLEISSLRACLDFHDEASASKFWAETRDGYLGVDAEEVAAFLAENPQPFNRASYLGQYADTHPEDTEPYTGFIKELAQNGLQNYGHHGPSASMGVDRNTLPKWEDLQFLLAQVAKRPLMDEDPVSTKVVIGPRAQRPLVLDLPLLVSDLSFGALSKEAKIALARGAELAGTGICSGEGGMLPEEQASNSRYFYQLASAKFGFSWDKVAKTQAFHFKGGQGAKTGTGGHLPGQKSARQLPRFAVYRKDNPLFPLLLFPTSKRWEILARWLQKFVN